MNKAFPMALAALSLAAALPAAAEASAPALDAEAANTLLTKNGCYRCHAIDRRKIGPAYKAVAAHYKDRPDAEEVLYRHVTTGPTIRIDEHEESHAVIKAPGEADIRNAIRFILSR